MTTGEFDKKVVALRGRVFRFALRLVADCEQAGDVAQDVMEGMWLRRGSLSAEKNIDALVMRAARNRCYDILRHRKVVDRSHAQIALHASPAGYEESGVERRELMEAIREAIGALPGKQRSAIHLRDVEGYEFEEIAEIMDCSVASVRMCLARARRAVREKLIKYVQS